MKVWKTLGLSRALFNDKDFETGLEIATHPGRVDNAAGSTSSGDIWYRY